jgi:hypothetical protein
MTAATDIGQQVVPSIVATGTRTFAGTAQSGTTTSFALTQPTLFADKLIRII